MSDQEHFLLRWSRRKREAADAPQPAAAPSDPPAPGQVDPAVAVEAREAPGPAETPAIPGEPLFDPDSLPPIESITAETDIRPFLAPGVPAELKVAALRRAWSADPAIRDFIGLSENSWDFNAPDAMGGFGSLEMTDDMRRMVAQLFSPAPQDRAAGAEVPAQVLETSAQSAPMRRTENAAGVSMQQDEMSDGKEETTPQGELSQAKTDIAAMQQPDRSCSQRASIARRCHGGALPK